MSITSEISRISQNVSDSLNAVAAKGVTVPSGSNSDDLAELIALIPTGSGIDWPTFTVTYDSNWENILSITCDKTFQECYSLATISNEVMAYEVETDGEYESQYSAQLVEYGAEYLNYYSGAPVSFIRISYHSDGSITGEFNPIPRRTGSDMTISGRTATAPAGYYETPASIDVPYGHVVCPSNIVGTGVTVSSGFNELTFTASANLATVVETPGYVSTAERVNSTITVSASIPTRGVNSLTASGATVTAPAGYYASDVTKTITSGTEGSPTATKGTVSNHSISVTPSVTNTAGYIAGGTHNGTAVSVSASELVSGTKTITENGTGIDVTEYASVDVNVTGSGGGPVIKKDVNFIDYDGTLLHSYTKAEINAMTSESDLPANPSHTGLVSQGWNWTLAQIKAQLTAMPNEPVTVGQMYVTESGDTEIDVEFPDAVILSPILTIAVNGKITVDWGDETTPDSITGTSLTARLAQSHTYSSVGNYTIKIHIVSGEYSFYCSSSYTILRKNTSSNQNRAYSNCVKSIRIGNGINNLGDYAFGYCYSLTSITIPRGVTSTGNSAFYNCYSLASITIPSGVTSIGAYVFNGCTSLAKIAIPSGVTSIGNNVFSSCFSLFEITIPSGVTSIENYMCSSCCSLAKITIPSGVTSIGAYVFNGCFSLSEIAIPSGVISMGDCVFTNCYSLFEIAIPSNVTHIGSQAFDTCHSLTSITIPSDVTSIGNSAFSGCYGVQEYHIKPTTPPTAGTSIFKNIISGCIIYVPYSADHSILEAYKTATNWSSYASRMQEEPQ